MGTATTMGTHVLGLEDNISVLIGRISSDLGLVLLPIQKGL